jgi:hypothetical protein
MMRNTAVILFGIIASAGLSGVPAAAKQAGQKTADDPSASIDQLAQKVFTSADQNHNHVLNKAEFRDAQAMLESTVEEWGRAGIIGKPKKPGNKQQDSANASASAIATANKLGKSNHVSQAEFTFYVHAFVEEADQQWRQVNAATAAQRKAMNAQRRVYPARGRRFVPYPFSY